MVFVRNLGITGISESLESVVKKYPNQQLYFLPASTTHITRDYHIRSGFTYELPACTGKQPIYFVANAHKLKVVVNDYISGGVIRQTSNSRAKTRGEGARDLARD